MTDGIEQQSANTTNPTSKAREALHATVGQIALLMSTLPRYRHETLASLHDLIVAPLVRNRASVAYGTPAKGGSPEAEPSEEPQLAGVAIWASVSDDVERKIREQIAAGVFPVRLKKEEWASGDAVWLLDLIAPSKRLAAALLANFKQVAKADNVNVHPLILRMLDAKALKQPSPSPQPAERHTESLSA